SSRTRQESLTRLDTSQHSRPGPRTKMVTFQMDQARGNQVLIIDDDAELCQLLSHYLLGDGFEVDTVRAGQQGVDRVLSRGYTIVILDVMMPGMNGFEVLRRIRAQSRIPVLMLTAKGDAHDRILGLEMGADDYLPKPFDPQELAARIRAILRRSIQDQD